VGEGGGERKDGDKEGEAGGGLTGWVPGVRVRVRLEVEGERQDGEWLVRGLDREGVAGQCLRGGGGSERNRGRVIKTLGGGRVAKGERWRRWVWSR